VEYDVTALMNGNGTYTFALIADSADGITFASREGVMPAQLLISVGTGSPLPTQPATSTSTGLPGATNTPTKTPGPTLTHTPTSTGVVASPTHTPAATSSIYMYAVQPDGITGTDTFLTSSSPATNYGADVAIGIGENNNATDRITRGLIRFDLSSIPSNATIVSATLSLWTASDLSDNDRTLRVYRLKSAFDEASATWSFASTDIRWEGPGASGPNDRESLEIGSIQLSASEAIGIQKQIALSPAKIQELVNGAFTNNGFIIVVDTELNDRFNYKSSDTTTASNRPMLVIQYTLP